MNLTHRKLDENDIDWVFEIAQSQGKHMGESKALLGFDDTFDTREYWEDWITGENKSTYATFKDNDFVNLSSIYEWSLMPYASRKNALSSPKVGFAARTIFPAHDKFVFDTMFQKDIVKIYQCSSYDMYDYVKHPRRRILFENFNRLMKESWTHCIEEIIEAGEMTKWKGFQNMVGYKTWPIKLIIKSWTHKDYGIH